MIQPGHERGPKNKMVVIAEVAVCNKFSEALLQKTVLKSTQ